MSLLALTLDFRKIMMTVTWSVERNPTDSVMEDAVVVEDGRVVVKQGFNMIVLDERHRCSNIRQLRTEFEHNRTEHLL